MLSKGIGCIIIISLTSPDSIIVENRKVRYLSESIVGCCASFRGSPRHVRQANCLDDMGE